MRRQNSRAEELKFYCELGWEVFPIYPPIRHEDGTVICACSKGYDCDAVGKHPAWKEWPELATSDFARLTRQPFPFSRFGPWPPGLEDMIGPLPINATFGPFNIGLHCGRGSGVFAIDIDPRHGGIEDLMVLSDLVGPLPKTVTNRTGGGGYHYIFQYDSRVRSVIGNNSGFTLNGRQLKGIDIRTDGGAITLPPSLHMNGRYEWIASPATTPIVEAPEAFLELFATTKKASGTTGPRKPRDPNAGLTEFQKAEDRYDEYFAEDWTKYGRHCPICGHLGCFGPNAKNPVQWYCFSSNHSSDWGKPATSGYFGGASILHAFKGNTTVVAVLKREGFY